MKFISITVLVATLASSACALHSMKSRDVPVVPRITNPLAGNVWHVGSIQNVTWDVSTLRGLPIFSDHGKIMLSKGPIPTPVILAFGFNIRTGWASVVVPWVIDGDDYHVEVIGDSIKTSDISPAFTIKQRSIF